MNEPPTRARRVFVIRLKKIKQLSKDLLYDLRHAGKEWWTLFIAIIVLQILIALYA